MLLLMLNVKQQLQSVTAKGAKRGLGELMSLCDENYIRFRQLAKCLENIEDESCSIKYGDATLYLHILQRSRYTTTVLLAYSLLDGDNRETMCALDMKIRVYHDARQVEVLACCRHDSEMPQWLSESACRSTLQWRWRINKFLHKWLDYCLKLGHGFPQEKPSVSWRELLDSI